MKVSFKHFLRECNASADALVKHGLSMSQGLVFFV